MTMPARLEAIVREVLPRDPSDLFLLPGEPPALRVPPDFVIERLDQDPLTEQEVESIATALAGHEALTALGARDARIRRRCGVAGEFGLTVSIAKALGVYTIACRFMQPRIPSIEEVSLPAAMVAMADAPNGLVLFSGPMGSGKTTSMLALLDHINATKAAHICTVEDPVNVYITPRKAIVQQREVGEDVPTILAGIQAALSQDLDVLMVDELKNVAELEGCFAAAETGHLVLTQVHEETPTGAIRRVLDVFPEEMQERARRALAAKLRAVCSQRLIRRKDGRGRVAVYAVLIPDEETREAIAHGGDLASRETPWPAGCQTLPDALATLVRDGVVSKEAAAGLAAPEGW